MKIIERIKVPTPKFFKKLRNIGIGLAAIGTSVIAAPVSLPAIVLKIAGYLAVASAVAGGIARLQ